MAEVVLLAAALLRRRRGSSTRRWRGAASPALHDHAASLSSSRADGREGVAAEVVSELIAASPLASLP